MDLASIILAIQLSALKLPEATCNMYAQVIKQQADKLEIDPIIIVAIIKHESRWNAGLISDDTFDYGLMQIRAKFYGGNPVNLLNPWTNIIVGSYFIKSSKEFCAKDLNRTPNTQEWLSCFQGTCGLVNKRCRPTKLTNRVAQYADCLKYQLEDKSSIYDCDFIYNKDANFGNKKNY